VGKLRRNIRASGRRTLDSWQEDMLANALDEVLGKDLPEHQGFLSYLPDVIKGIKAPRGKSTDVVSDQPAKRDFDALCNAWDAYASDKKNKHQKLRSIADVESVMPNARGPPKKGEVGHREMALGLKKEWYLSCHRKRIMESWPESAENLKGSRRAEREASGEDSLINERRDGWVPPEDSEASMQVPTTNSSTGDVQVPPNGSKPTSSSEIGEAETSTIVPSNSSGNVSSQANGSKGGTMVDWRDIWSTEVVFPDVEFGANQCQTEFDFERRPRTSKRLKIVVDEDISPSRDWFRDSHGDFGNDDWVKAKENNIPPTLEED
jgi:hypothetical protein